MTFPWSAGSGGGGWRFAVASGGCGQRWAASPRRAELGSARRPRRRAPGECSGCRRDRRQAVPLTGGGFSGRGGGPRPYAGGGAAGRAGTRALSALGNGRRVSTPAARARGGGWAGPGPPVSRSSGCAALARRERSSGAPRGAPALRVIGAGLAQPGAWPLAVASSGGTGGKVGAGHVSEAMPSPIFFFSFL